MNIAKGIALAGLWLSVGLIGAFNTSVVVVVMAVVCAMYVSEAILEVK